MRSNGVRWSDEETDHPISFGLLLSTLVSVMIAFRGDLLNIDLLRESVLGLGMLVMGSVLLFETWRNGYRGVARWPLILPPAILLGYCWASLGWSANQGAAATVCLMWTQAAAVGVISFIVCVSASRISLLCKVLTVAGTVLAYLGCLQATAKIDWVVQLIAPASLFINKNFAAQVMVLLLPASIYWVITEPRIRVLRLAWLCLGIQTLFALFTGARAAWLAILLEGVVFGVAMLLSGSLRGMLWQALHRAALTVSLLVVLLLGIFAITPDYGFRARSERVATDLNTVLMSDQVEKRKVGGTWLTREHLRKNAVQVFQSAPLTGVGVGNLAVHSPLPGNTDWDPNPETIYETAHSDPFQFLAETGLIGILLMAGMAGLWFYLTIRQRPFQGLERWHERVLVVSSMAAVGFFVNGLYSFPAYKSVPTMLLGMWLGLLLRMLFGREQTLGTIRVLSKPGRWTVAGGAIACAVLVAPAANLAYREVASSHQLRILKSLRNQDPPTALRAAAEARRLGEDGASWHHNYAGALYAVGNYEQARRLLEDNLQRSFTKALDLANMGLSALAMGQPEQAESDFRAALELRPNQAHFQSLLARAVQMQGRTDEAYQLLKEAALDLPIDRQVIYVFVEIAQSSGDLEAAIKALERVLGGSRGPARAHASLAGLYELRGQDGDAALARDHYRAAFLARGHPPEARVWAERYRALARNEPGD